MFQDRADLKSHAQVQSQDPVGVIAGQFTTARGSYPHHDAALEGSFEIAWTLAH
jgi:hypothetical protein